MRGRQHLAAAATLAGALLAAQELRGQTAGPAIETLLRELDERFVRGDVAGYLAHFTPDNPGALSIRGRQLERLVRASRARKRTSSVVSGPARIGDRALLRVRRTIELVDAAGATRRTVEDSLLALRDDGTPTFSIEAPTAATTPAAGRFTCDPCNVAIGGVDGFRERSLKRVAHVHGPPRRRCCWGCWGAGRGQRCEESRLHGHRLPAAPGARAPS